MIWFTPEFLDLLKKNTQISPNTARYINRPELIYLDRLKPDENGMITFNWVKL